LAGPNDILSCRLNRTAKYEMKKSFLHLRNDLQ
jgi:hypothetical protein